MRRAKIHVVDPDRCSGKLYGILCCRLIDSPELTAELTKKILADFPLARRGDIVKIARLADHLNEWTFIFDGRVFKRLSTNFEIDSLGFVPPDFSVLGPEGFGPKYWSDAVAHNRVVWFNAVPYASQIMSPAQPFGFTPDFWRRLAPLASFTLAGENYLISLSPSVAALSPEVVGATLKFALERGPLPWCYCEASDPQSERVLVIGKSIYDALVCSDPQLASTMPLLFGDA